MKVEITELAEHEVELLTAVLELHGFRPDEDYEPLHGTLWALTGVRLKKRAPDQLRALVKAV